MNVDKKTILDLSLEDLKLILEYVIKDKNTLFCYDVIEIIRKYISLKSRYLIKDLKKKFGSLYNDYLNLFHLIFLEVVKTNIFSKGGFLDISIINSILSLKNSIKISSVLSKEIDSELNKLGSYLSSLKNTFFQKNFFGITSNKS